ncbi:MAG: DNA methyltransferase [Bacteroidetes bacterium]|nr:DNA methyltransferase [Bacteroidota bacterium]
MKHKSSSYTEELKRLSALRNLDKIRTGVNSLYYRVVKTHTDRDGLGNFPVNGQSFRINKEYLLSEFSQIQEAHSIERAKYYIKRLIKSLNEIRLGKLNDINLNRWKEYNDIVTDSLWEIDKRDRSGTHTAGYWGNFVPQIPNQLLRRYTKKNDWVLDAFLGSGTTLIECKKLGRNGIGVELQPSIARKAQQAIDKENSEIPMRCPVIVGDSKQLNLSQEIKKYGTSSVQFVLLHPPYWDIIKFSNNDSDLSNSKTINDFLSDFGKVVDNCSKILDQGRYLAVVIGDKYSDGNWIPLGFYTMQEVLNRNYSLKSIIVKNFKQTKAKRGQERLWRYRALVGGFYVFKHEYIFLFKKIVPINSLSSKLQK